MTEAHLKQKQAKASGWPFAIAGSLALFAAGLVALIVVAGSGRMELVTSDYYEQELRHQKHLDKLGRARELASPARVLLDASEGVIRIQLPAEHAKAGAQGEVVLYRPSSAAHDRRVALALDAMGSQRLAMAEMEPGLWRIRVDWQALNQDYCIEDRIRIPSRGRP